MTDKIIGKKDVEYVAKLAKVRLDESQKERFLKQLNDILSYFKKLNELDTDQVEPTSYILHSSNMFHEDIVKPSLRHETVLGLTQYKKNGYFKVPRIL